MDSLNKLKVVYKALDDKKAIDIRMLDISNLSPIADYFVIASASNASQLEAFEDEIKEKMAEAKEKSPKSEGKRGSGWILIDYGDVIVHLFLESDRSFYEIERIWADAVDVAPEDIA